MEPIDSRNRVVIENLTPQVDGGRFAVKRVVGDKIECEADIFVDGHDLLSSELLFRRETDTEWSSAPMRAMVNDRWRGSFTVRETGRYRFTVRAWLDRFKTWQRDLEKKVEAGLDVSLELLVGARLVREGAGRAQGELSAALGKRADALEKGSGGAEGVSLGLSSELATLMERSPDLRSAVTFDPPSLVVVDREKARFSTWYEMFPRSIWGSEPGDHGTFRMCEERLPYLAEMGFDVLYLPPIHPIGTTHRKGKNNTTVPAAGDPGSPWAIGSSKGGHKAVHPRLGTIQEFRSLLEKAGRHGIEIALDLAFQCSPDHPYVAEHPEWFRKRPDGSIQYAENPPKKYEDIFPIHFETEHWRDLYSELKGVVLFWIEQGVRIFRVDNPHTKPFPFWEWLIHEVKERHPDVIFLAEAFTRPKVMYRLAKLGFTQSYTYFAWRNTKWEITEYFKELTTSPVREFFGPNLWPNTPDILTEYLQNGERPGFMVRVVLAATLGASYGIYGPAFELCSMVPREPGSEEYLHSEKYEIRKWAIDDPSSLRVFIGRLNRIRRENPALRSNLHLRFHETDHDQVLCYSKHTEDGANIIFVVINLDPHYAHGAWVHFPVSEMGLDPRQGYQMHDLLGDGRFLWHGSRNYLEIDPRVSPAFVFRVRKRLRTERDFDYFM